MKRLFLIASLMFFVSGCATVFNEKTENEICYYFACNYWIDRNQDKKIDLDEWEGIKDIFYENEHISFVAYFNQKPGTPLSFKLISPDGSVYKEKTLKQTAKTTVWCQEYEAKDLVNNKGPGIWKIEWYAGSQLVNITFIRIFKIPGN